MAQYKFFAKDEIPDGVYKDVKGVETIAVGAQWTTSSKQPTTISSTRSPRRCGATRRAPRSTPATPRARRSRRRPRSLGVGIPLHAGAEKFYKEAGLLK